MSSIRPRVLRAGIGACAGLVLATTVGSPASAAHSSYYPSPVLKPDVEASPGTLAVSWLPPVSGGFSNVAGYTIRVDGQAGCSTVEPGCTITGLTDGRIYAVDIDARNAHGFTTTVRTYGIAGEPSSHVVLPHGGIAMQTQGLGSWADATEECQQLRVDVTTRDESIYNQGWQAALQLRQDGRQIGSAVHADGLMDDGGTSLTVPVCHRDVPSGPLDVVLDLTVGSKSHQLTSHVEARGDVVAAPTQTTLSAAPVGKHMRVRGTVTVSDRSGKRPATGAVQLIFTRPDGRRTMLQHSPYLTLDASGSFWEMSDDEYPPGTTVQAVYLGGWKLAGSRSAVITPNPAPAPPKPQPRPKATVKVKAVSKASKLHVDVNPNQGPGYWTVQVQVKQKNGTWRAMKTYKTQGKAETRTINLPKGTYRVVVQPKYGYAAGMSSPVTLKR